MGNNLLTVLLQELNDGRLEVIDLTKPLEPATPVIVLPPQFADAPAFSIETLCRYDEKGPNWYWNVIRFGEHTGTHFDAPIHWVTGRDLPQNSCDKIPPRQFIGPACVIDVVAEAASSADYMLYPEQIKAWENEHSRIPQGAWVLMGTDWSKKRSAEDFLNIDESGAHYPGFHKSAVEFLVHERDILGVGVETVGIDPGQADKFDPPFPNHATILGAGKFGLASLSNLDKLPPVGAVIFAAPLKIVQGSGSPVRAFALVSQQ